MAKQREATHSPTLQWGGSDCDDDDENGITLSLFEPVYPVENKVVEHLKEKSRTLRPYYSSKPLLLLHPLTQQLILTILEYITTVYVSYKHKYFAKVGGR